MNFLNRVWPEGTVLLLGVQYAGMSPKKVFTYAMLLAGEQWYLTGGTGKVPTAASGPAVLRWLQRDGRELVSVQVVTETKPVWALFRQATVTGGDLDTSQ